jgi:polysaccharide export outer membrane protein
LIVLALNNRYVFIKMKRVLSSSPVVWLSSAFLLAYILLGAGCSSDKTASIPPAGPGPRLGSGPGGGQKTPQILDDPDALRVGELLVVEFTGVQDPPVRHEERIKQDGRITLPSIGPVQAAGVTRGQLEEAIHEKYVPNYYKQLTVTVRNEGRYFYVGGQVKNPSQYPYLKEMTVLRAIANAGDFTDFAKKSDVKVTRSDGRQITINCIKAQRDPRLDVPIYPDDRIFVPRRYF